ncbi:MAG: 4-hydroxythreonine-4-phosphate dehydrogenase PdxA, partial [Desulfohalobiaceae bacterium]|nr:4-hydroxythreonine-4-phosphate dehydrogenase PdxA [Desulfohalobiaceae bacterium]
MKHQPLLLTLGDPNGLGPELTVRLLSKSNKQGLNRPLLLIGPVKALEHHSAELGLSPFWEVLPDLERLPALQAAVYAYTPAELKDLEILPGRPRIQGGLAAGVSLDTACGLIRQGLARGLVTCPLNKAMLSEAGYPFSGHTEFLARSFGLDPDAVCMHLAGPKLRVSLVTTHPPLR